jgi:nucleotide-binding universal stress UspA family protein
MLLAAPRGRVELVPLPQLTDHGDRALRDACTAHDLLALGAGTSALHAVGHAPIPVLIARWLPLAISVTDRILVPVDGSPGSTRALVFAGRLAAAHGGTVAILADPPRDAALQRAIAASQRIILQATGTAPRLVGEQLPREEVIRSTATALRASLVVLGKGHSEIARSLALQIADRLGASVLAVPG